MTDYTITVGSPNTVVVTPASPQTVTVTPQAALTVNTIVNPTAINVNQVQLVAAYTDTITIVSGTTQYQLGHLPAVPHQSICTLNGLKQIYGVDYYINGQYLIWISSIALDVSSYLEILYS
jgi:hypothetical protein